MCILLCLYNNNDKTPSSRPYTSVLGIYRGDTCVSVCLCLVNNYTLNNLYGGGATRIDTYNHIIYRYTENRVTRHAHANKL